MSPNRYEHETIKREINKQLEQLPAAGNDPQSCFARAKAKLEHKYQLQIGQVAGFEFGDLARKEGTLGAKDHERIKNLIDGFMVPSASRPLERAPAMFERAKGELTEVLEKYLSFARAFRFTDMNRVVS